MRITAKGQVTIPQAVRDAAGLLPGTDVAITLEKGVVTLRKAASGAKAGRGRTLAARLRGAATVKMRTEEIMALMRGPRDDLGERDDPGRFQRPHRRRPKR